MNQQDRYIAMLKKREAWLEGHFLLTSGLHSAQYVQCAKALQWPEDTAVYGRALAEAMLKASKREIALVEPEGVVSPALGGLIIGHEVAKNRWNARAMFTERDADRKMTLRRGFHIEIGASYWVVEDVITTGKSTKEVIDVITSLGGVVSCVGCVLNRSTEDLALGVPVAQLIRYPIVNYEADKLPPELAAIPAVKPGSRPQLTVV